MILIIFEFKSISWAVLVSSNEKLSILYDLYCQNEIKFTLQKILHEYFAVGNAH